MLLPPPCHFHTLSHLPIPIPISVPIPHFRPHAHPRRFGASGPSTALSPSEASALAALAAARDLRLAFLYTVRSRSQAALAGPLAAWAASLPFLTFTLHVSGEEGGRVHTSPALAHAVEWLAQGRRALDAAREGGVTRGDGSAAGAGTGGAGGAEDASRAEVDAYVCGPTGFSEGVGAALGGLGVAPGRVHTESFAY